MNRPVVSLVLILLVLPLILIMYRVMSLGYPLFPAAPQKVWQLSLDAQVADSDTGSTIMIGLPSSRQGVSVLEEKIGEGALDFSLRTEGQNRFGIWSGKGTPDGAVISYRALISVNPGYAAAAPSPQSADMPPGVTASDRVVAERLVGQYQQLAPADRLQSVVADATGNWASPPSADDRDAWASIQKKLGSDSALLILMRAAGLDARPMEGLKLSEGVTSVTVGWIEAWTGAEWHVVQPGAGSIRKHAAALLPLTRDGVPVVRMETGRLADIRWTLNRQTMSQWSMQFERIGRSEHLLDRWSLFRLPAEFQGTFRILLLVPLGALMICILRNVIGFPTFGIFMPVLMALAFRSTGLGYGLGIFAIVLLIGFVARRSLEKLRLLLVPRLSVMVTLVIACFTVFALLGNKFDLKAFMAIGLLPFVILTMAIERFFVITEEEGIIEALRTAAGSAIVATITYGIIQFEPLQLTFFVYPELLLVIMAAQVLIGRYTGYRLSEFLRFRNLRRDRA